MTLPTNYLACLLAAIFSLLCGVAWANSVKLSGKRRFELFYFDFAAGVMLTAVVVALTLGTLGTDGFVLMDDFLHAGRKRRVARRMDTWLGNPGLENHRQRPRAALASMARCGAVRRSRPGPTLAVGRPRRGQRICQNRQANWPTHLAPA